MAADDGSTRIVVIGSGGVGAALAAIATRRGFFSRLVMADVDEARARRAIAAFDDDRLGAAAVDASDEGSLRALLEGERAQLVLNAVDPLFNEPIFAAAR